MNNIDNIYYINLDKDTHKNKNILSEFNKVGIKNPIRIPGIYGENMSKIDIDNNTNILCSSFCTASAIGCALSHINTWKEIIKNNDRYAMICEDDIHFIDKNFIQLYNKLINEVPKDFDILYIGCISCEKEMPYNPYFLSIDKPKTIKIINSYEIREPGMTYGAHCYIISNATAKKLVDYFQQNGIKTHVDVMLQNLARKHLIKRYTIAPNLVLQTSLTDLSISANAKNFPILFNTILKKYELFPRLPLDYAMTSNVGRIYKYNINMWTAVFILLGILLYRYNPVIILIVYLFLTLPDLSIPKPQYIQYIVKLFILLTPSLLNHFKII